MNSSATTENARAMILVQIAALALPPGIERLVFVWARLGVVASAVLVIAGAAHVLGVVLPAGVGTGGYLVGSGGGEEEAALFERETAGNAWEFEAR